MNDLQNFLPGKLDQVLESLCYNAGTGWQRQITLWVPLVLMIFLFTELLSRSEAKRKGNVICLIQVLIGTTVILLTLVQSNAVLFVNADALHSVGGSLLSVFLAILAVLTPLGMLLSGTGYGTIFKAWLTTVLAAAGFVAVSNIAWQLLGKSKVTVIAMEGTVKYRNSPLQWWSGISGTNATFPEGTIFKTGSSDSATLRLGPATVVSVRPDSVMMVRLYNGMPEVVVESGKLVGDVVPGQNERFIIRSPAAWSGVLGTRFMVRTDREKISTTTVAEGFVRVVGKAVGSSEVTVDGGMSAQVLPGRPPENPKPAAAQDLEEINKVFPQHHQPEFRR